MITLTVTDNLGATGTTTQTVAVTVPNPAPVASFTATPTGASVAVDASASTDDGSIAGYAWDFGDGTQGTGKTTSHTYRLTKSYTITLTVTDNLGATGTTTQTVAVTVPNPAPVASFTATPTGASVAVDASASTDDGSIAGYAWDFGDGTQGTGKTTSHTYGLTKSYVITLTVTDNLGATGTTTQTVAVTVPNPAPVASFTATPTGASVAVDASASTDDGSIAGYAWDFGDGTQGTGKTTSHTYGLTKSYMITLTVTDNLGATGTTTQTVAVTVPNPAPVASFTATPTGASVAVDASASTDDGSIAGYAWDFGDGTQGTGKTTSHTYGLTKSYVITLTVTDNLGATGTTTQTVAVTVPNPAPVASFTATPTGASVAVDASASTDDGSIASYAWDFGDGTQGTGKTTSHTYGLTKSYVITLTVTDNLGATGTTTQTVAVTVPASGSVASDAFARTVANGWGTADTGGAWSLTGPPSAFAVNGSAGSMSMAAAGSVCIATLTSVSALNLNAAIDTSINNAATGNGISLTLIGRQVGKYNYQLKERILPGGAVHLVLSKVVNGVETIFKETNISGLTYNTGDVTRVRFQISTSGTTTSLSGKVWKVGTVEPAIAQITQSDSEATLQKAGNFALQSYLSSSSTNAPTFATFDNLLITTN